VLFRSARNDTDLSECLLSLRSCFGLVEVSKAVALLDAGRCARIIEKNIKRLQIQKTPVSSKKLGKLKSDLDNLKALKTTVCIADIEDISIFLIIKSLIISLSEAE